MNIAVCVCQVPDTASVIGYNDGAIDYSRVHEVMNPYDEYALEEAVRLKEHFDDSLVTVFFVAPESSKEVLRKALAKGADKAVLVSCSAVVSDPYQIAHLLSQALTDWYQAVLPDIVFCGKQSTDIQSAQVPAMLAEMLGIASVNSISVLNVEESFLSVERQIEGGTEYIDVQCPVVLSADKGLNTPRNTSVRAVMDARKKTIDIVPASYHHEPFVLMTDVVPLERKKQCCMVSSENELIQILSRDHNVF
ncbi:MAG: electron transfer flavoprotein subunit beta/FixA family protein [Chlorobium sp.]